MAHVISESVQMMKIMVSGGDFPSVDEIDKFITGMNDRSIDAKEAARRAEELDRKLIVNEFLDLRYFRPEMMKKFDEDAKSIFKLCEMTIGVPDDDYITQLNIYVRAVIRRLSEFQKDHALTPGAAGKFRWMMARRPNRPVPRPFMTNYVVETLEEQLQLVKLSVDEVSGFCS